MWEGLPQLQFSHTKLGFTTDLRKPPHEETPPPLQKKKIMKKKPLPASIRTDLNWFFCVKGQVPRATAWTGEGGDWFAFVLAISSAEDCLAPQFFLQKIYLHCLKTIRTIQLILTDRTPFLLTANALSQAKDVHRLSVMLCFGTFFTKI